MISRLSRRLEVLGTRGPVIVATLVFIVFTATALPAQARRSEVYAAGGPTPDTSFFYTADQIYRWALAYGVEGRSDYIHARFTFDVVWPLVYTFFLVALLSWLLPRIFANGSRWRLLNLLPVAVLICDYLENITAAIVVSRVPATTPVLADLVTVFTMLKWLSLTAAFVLVVVLAVVALVRRLRGHGTAHHLTEEEV